MKEIAESILNGLNDLDEVGWQACIRKCPTCIGRGTVHEIQDEQPGQEWCPSCGGDGEKLDTDKFRKMQIELIMNHLSWVECYLCGTRGPYAMSKESAIAARNTRVKGMMELKDLKPGDHFEIIYGFHRRMFYTIENHPKTKTITATRRTWLVSHAEVFVYAGVLEMEYRYIGRGKKRWWRPLCLFMWNRIPIYSKPY